MKRLSVSGRICIGFPIISDLFFLLQESAIAKWNCIWYVPSIKDSIISCLWGSMIALRALHLLWYSIAFGINRHHFPFTRTAGKGRIGISKIIYFLDIGYSRLYNYSTKIQYIFLNFIIASASCVFAVVVIIRYNRFSFATYCADNWIITHFLCYFSEEWFRKHTILLEIYGLCRINQYFTIWYIYCTIFELVSFSLRYRNLAHHTVQYSKPRITQGITQQRYWLS